MTRWSQSILAWRAISDLGLLLVVFYMPLAREWTHWNIASQVNFFTLHLWILRVDLRAYGQLDHKGMFMMTRSDFLVYVWSLVAGWFVDANSVAFQIWHLSNEPAGNQDAISEQRIQLFVFGFMLVLTGLRTIYFGLVYDNDPSKFSMHPHTVAAIAHHASVTGEELKEPSNPTKPTYKPISTTEPALVNAKLSTYTIDSNAYLRGATRASLVSNT